MEEVFPTNPTSRTTTSPVLILPPTILRISFAVNDFLTLPFHLHNGGDVGEDITFKKWRQKSSHTTENEIILVIIVDLEK